MRRWTKLLSVLLLVVLLAGCYKKPVEENPTTAQNNSSEEAVEFSHQGGVYGEEFSLTLRSREGLKLYYTLDGSDPANSTTAKEYTAPISITSRKLDKNIVSAVDPDLFCTNHYEAKTDSCSMNPPSEAAVDKCTTVRVAEKLANGEFGTTYTQSYFIGTMEEHIAGLAESCKAAGTSLAVISITMDYDDLFDYNTGIYVKGLRYDVAYSTWNRYGEARKLEANYTGRGSAWERAAHMEMYEVNATSMECVLSQDCGIRIQGNYSRSDLQKSFRLLAKSKYGPSRFSYEVFGDECTDRNGKVIGSFDKLVLRAGGNCAFNAKFNDTYWQSLIRDAGLDVSTKCTRPAVVYLNGEYWGLYVLEEDYCTEYFDDHYDVKNDDVVIYKGDAEKYDKGYTLDEGELPEGADQDYFLQELKDFYNSHTSVAKAEDYEALCELVDPDSFLDYISMEVWINNKWDWPGKNWSMWKSLGVATKDETNEYNDGRWRLLVYDVEFGGVSGASEAGTNTVKEDNYKQLGLFDQNTNNPVIRTFALLMTNEAFAEEFCNRLEALSTGAFEQTAALQRLEEFSSIYGPLYEQFFLRYPGSGSAKEALEGGYASATCICQFLQKRAATIPSIIRWTKSKL